MHKQPSPHGELRQELITGDWVVIASGRSKRPDEFASKENTKSQSWPAYKNDCVFCNLIEFSQEPETLRLPDDPHDWQVHIFKNKYPAFTPEPHFRSWNVGPYRATEAVGYHEILAPKDHNKFEGLISVQDLALQMEALVLRYRQLKSQPSVNYIQIIKNHGEQAGASIEHPHHQILTVPVLPNDVAKLLQGAEAYALQNKKDVFSTMIDFEKQEHVRIVYENDLMIAFCPFASRVPFETWIMPKKHEPFFENIGPQERQATADALRQILGRLYKGLNNPPYNYYIHSAPCDDTGFSCNISAFQHFRWHIEILPRLTKFAGFELGTGIEINTMTPEASAAFLREQNA